jgi:hypothetical protein
MHFLLIALVGVIAFAVVFGRGAAQSVLGIIAGLFVAFFLLVLSTGAHAEGWPDLSGVIRAVAGLKPLPNYAISDPRPSTPEEEQQALARMELRDAAFIRESQQAAGMTPLQRVAAICNTQPGQACAAMIDQEDQRVNPIPPVELNPACQHEDGTYNLYCLRATLPPQVQVYIQQRQSYSTPTRRAYDYERPGQQ